MKGENFEQNNKFWLKTKDQLDVTCYFYFIYYALNMFRTLIYPSSGAYDYSVVFLVRCVLVFRRGWFGMVPVLQAEAPLVFRPATWIPLQPNHTETPTHIEPRTHDQCGNPTE